MEIFKKTLLGVLGIETTYTRALGIDIGSSAVKFSEVSSSESGMRIESYHIEPIPDEVVYMGKIEDHLAVVDAIKRGLASNNFRAKNNASLAIAYSMATIREMTIFGNLSQEELAVRAYSEAVHVTGGSVHDLAIDFCEDKSPDKDKRKFLLAISKKENVDDIVYLLKDSGITPRIIDVELYAFHTMCIRFLELNPPLLKKSNIYLFVEFGHSKTLFLFMRGQEVIFAKEQSFGFVSLSREVKSELDLDYASAQRMIAGIDKAQERYSEIILPEFISECCSVVYRILQLFYTTTSFVNINAMFISGGGSSLPGIAKAIKKVAEVDVKSMKAISERNLSSSISKSMFFHDLPRLTTSIGIAIRNLLNDSI